VCKPRAKDVADISAEIGQKWAANNLAEIPAAAARKLQKKPVTTVTERYQSTWNSLRVRIERLMTAVECSLPRFRVALSTTFDSNIELDNRQISNAHYFHRPSADAAGHGQGIVHSLLHSPNRRYMQLLNAVVCWRATCPERRTSTVIHMHLLQESLMRQRHHREKQPCICVSVHRFGVTDVLWKRCSAPGKPLLFTSPEFRSRGSVAAAVAAAAAQRAPAVYDGKCRFFHCVAVQGSSRLLCDELTVQGTRPGKAVKRSADYWGTTNTQAPRAAAALIDQQCAVRLRLTRARA